MSTVTIREYRPGDEQAILEGFRAAFHHDRSLSHWRWKFLGNPYGGPFIAMALAGDELACHYSAYPVRLLTDRGEVGTMQVGDTFTNPRYRSLGHGRSNLLTQTVAYFHSAYCEGKVDFFYGFNTGRIQKLGRLFLRYEPIAPVFEYQKVLPADSDPRGRSPAWPGWLSGIRTEIASYSGPWANRLAAEAAPGYGMLVKRDQAYLQWRYDHNPDTDYRFFLLKRRGAVRGMLVFKVSGDVLEVGDALCEKGEARTLIRRFDAYARELARARQISRIEGWFSDYPSWWSEALRAEGYLRVRERNELDLCATFFSERFGASDLASAFYFTKGDSDLF